MVDELAKRIKAILTGVPVEESGMHEPTLHPEGEGPVGQHNGFDTNLTLASGALSASYAPSRRIFLALTALATTACAHPSIGREPPAAQTEHFRIYGLSPEDAKRYGGLLERDLEKLVKFTGRPFHAIADVHVGNYRTPFTDYLGPIRMSIGDVQRDVDPRPFELSRVLWGNTGWGASTTIAGVSQQQSDKRAVFPLDGRDIYEATPLGVDPLSIFEDFSGPIVRIDRLEYLVSISFGAFLIKKFGIDKFLDFYELTVGYGDTGARRRIDPFPNRDLIVFGQRLQDLRGEWQEEVRRGGKFDVQIKPSSRMIPFGNEYDKPTTVPQIQTKNFSRIPMTNDGEKELKRRAKYAYRVAAAIFGEIPNEPLTIEVNNDFGWLADREKRYITQSWRWAPVGRLTLMYSIPTIFFTRRANLTFEEHAIGSFLQYWFDERRAFPTLGGIPEKMVYYNQDLIRSLGSLTHNTLPYTGIDAVAQRVEGIVLLNYLTSLFGGDQRKAVTSLARIAKGESYENVFGRSLDMIEQGMRRYIIDNAPKIK